MEKELNIAAILKGKPENTKLWSDTFGVMFLTECMEDSFYVKCSGDNLVWSYLPNGTFRKYMGIMSIFPSKSMRDWSKFAWKKGDVLKVTTGGDCSCIFDRFTNEDYTEFTGVFDKYLDRFDHFSTSDWCKVTDEKEYESIIQRIETQYGGKLNLDTLKIEKPQFKDGDIVHDVMGNNMYIIKEYDKKYIKIHAGISKRYGTISHGIGISSIFDFRLATEEEKQELFAALKKEGKRWNAETKTLENLPKKCEFKAFDKVLARIGSKDYWGANLYSHKTGYYHICIDGSSNLDCIPYNDQTAHLLGTTDDWKGGKE